MIILIEIAFVKNNNYLMQEKKIKRARNGSFRLPQTENF